MTENFAEIPQEGANPFDNVEEENDDSASSQDETNDTDETQSPDGDGTNNQDDPDKDKPFHEHPRWKQRESEWDKRFNDQEARHQEEIQKLREEFGGKKDDPPADAKIPSWFGGTPEQWAEFLEWNNSLLSKAEEKALGRVNEAKTAEEKAVAEATEYMRSEIAAIQADEKLNPTGAKIDPNKLLKIVMDNDLIDSKGRWNYRAGFRIMNAGNNSNPDNGNKDRKKIAGATTSESNPESKPVAFKTSQDFKKNRPW